MTPQEIEIPRDMLPSDGRFGSGPSKVRPEAVDALARAGASYLGTSHRQSAVRSMVGRLRAGLTDLFGLPEDYEVVLGNGGATAFWDAAAFGLVESRSQHFVFGEFSGKFAAAIAAAPHLDPPRIDESEPGMHPEAARADDVDVHALTHNETSTGVTMPVARLEGGLVVVDGTSAAGGMRVDPAQFDVYYFSPQKGFGADGGLWVALISPAALERIERLSSDRYVPPSLDLAIAVANSRKDQTYNTPGLASLFLMVDQIEWILGRGGLAWSASRCDASSCALYEWAEARPYAMPFVRDRAARSPVVGTIDFEGVDASAITSALRANGIVDTEPYRSLGRNQLRIGMYPAVEPTDVEALTRCIDFVVQSLQKS